MFFLRPIFTALMLFSLVATAPAQAGDSISSMDKEELGAFIRDYLMKNPEVLIDAIGVYRERQKLAQEERATKNLALLRDQLERTENDPLIGNPNGDVTLVEFFDYQCGYCKSMAGPLMKTVKEDGNVRLILKEFPILGEASVFAARASLAARNQGKYEEFHMALIRTRGRLNEKSVLQAAHEVGLDMKQLQADMNSSAIREEIDRNYALAQKLEIEGTPAFTIGNDLVPGAVSAEQLKALIQKARKS